MPSTVEDVMTRDVVCAHEDTPYKELVKLLAGRRVSAVPVVDRRRHVLGVVSEADLLLKQEKPARAGLLAPDGATPAAGAGQDRSDGRSRADDPAGGYGQREGDTA